MGRRQQATAVGGGITTFLVTAVLLIELLDFEFSAVVGLPVGLLVGVVFAAGVWFAPDRQPVAVQRLVSAYAVVGPTVIVLFGLRYIHIGRQFLAAEVIAGFGLVAAVVVYAGLWLTEQ